MGLITRKFSTNLFTYDGTTKTFIAEISSLGMNPGQAPPDFITLISERTSQPRTFPYLDAKRDREGDIVSWHYVSGDLKITIFNT